MKRLIFVLLILLSGSGSSLAQDSFTDIVKIEDYPSPAWYIAHASELEARALLIRDNREQVKEYGRAIAHLLMIPKRWPDDRASILNARLRVADISLQIGGLNEASEQLDLAEDIAATAELPLIVRRRLEIATAREDEEAGKLHAKWLSRGRIEGVSPAERARTYRALLEFHDSVGDFRNVGRRAEEYARLELEGIPAASLRIQAARSFLAANDKAKVRELSAEARHDLLAASGGEKSVRRQELIQALHKGIDELLME